MTDRYENIRRALALLDSEDAFDRATGHATLRDQCHPGTIRALLAERDALLSSLEGVMHWDNGKSEWAEARAAIAAANGGAGRG